MALICCPECKNEISNLAEKCPHCGLPNKYFLEIKTAQYHTENISEPNFNVVLRHVKQGESRSFAINYLVDNLGFNRKDAYKSMLNFPVYAAKNISREKAESIVTEMNKNGCNAVLEEYSGEDYGNVDLHSKYGTIVCSRCGSTSITTTSRGYSFWTGFLGSGKTVNRCAKCGNTWQPK